MAYTQAELDELRAKYPGIDINAIQQASGGGTVTDPIITPEQAATNLRTAQIRQASPTGFGGLGPSGASTSHIETDQNGVRWIVNDGDGSRVQEGDHNNTFLGNLADFGNNATAGLLPKGNEVVQRVVNTQPIYQTGEIKGPVPTPFGGYGVTVPKAQGVPIGNQVLDTFKGLVGSIPGSLGLGGSGGGAPAPPPSAPLNPAAFGWGNFSPAAQQQSSFFNDLAAYHANQAAPTLQRTGVDWSGMVGGGMGYAPPAPQQSAYPSMPPPTGQTVGGGLGTVMNGYTPPPTPGAGALSNQASPIGGGFGVVSPTSGGGGGGGGGSAPQAGAYGPQQAQPTVSGTQGAPNTLPTAPGYLPGPQPQAPPPQSAPSSSQFANPLFQQSQQSRGVTQGVMGQLENPNMYATPQQGVEAGGRAAEMTALNRAADPNLTRTAEGAQQQQSRGIQGATMAATTAPNLYNTPGAAQQDAARQQQQSFLQRLSSDMNGGQPSLAELQLRRGSDAVVANANALAASAGPGGAAMARRQAMQTAAGQGGKLAADTAELRAKEYAQARGEMGGALTNLRGQDITNQGQGFQNITATQDRAAQQAIALRSADLQAAGMSYDNAIKQAQLEQSGAQGLRSGDIQRLGQEYTNTTQQAQMASQMAIQSRAQDLTALGMSYDNAFKQAQLEAQQNQFQGTMDMQQRGLNLEGEKMGYGMGLDVQQSDLASRQHLQDLEAQRYAADRNYQFQQTNADNARFDKYLGAGVSGAATLLSMLSDKRQKTDIEEADPKDLSDFLGKLKESTFRYKDEKNGKGDHVGVMAQDVEKSRVGKTIIVETPSGKALDMKKALGALLAAGAAQEKRLRKLEART